MYDLNVEDIDHFIKTRGMANLLSAIISILKKQNAVKSEPYLELLQKDLSNALTNYINRYDVG